MEFKYFTIKDYESIKDFIRRIKFEIKGNYYHQSISPIMGKGIQIMTIIDETLQNPIKLEVSMYDIDELCEYYPLNQIKEKANRIIKRSDGLGDIGDLYK